MMVSQLCCTKVAHNLLLPSIRQQPQLFIWPHKAQKEQKGVYVLRTGSNALGSNFPGGHQPQG
eukprot:1160598-Pelagomonas_calceolata.AAC.6